MILDNFSLSQKTALVTGAGRGIGKAIALGFAEAGARVIAIARNSDELSNTISEIEKSGGSGEFHTCDITNEEQVAELFSKLSKSGIVCDILVNNAGINIRKRAFDSNIDEWNQVLATNLTSAFRISTVAARKMVEHKKIGRIVNIGSIAGLVSCDTGAAYAASKAGVSGLTRALAVEWAEHKITVNCIAPWYFKTPLTEPVLADPEKREKILRRTPLRRVGEFSDIASLAVFLSSPASSFITGQIIALDGGMSIFGFSPFMEC